MAEYVDLGQRVEVQFYDEMCEEWSIKTETIGLVLDSVCDSYEIADVVEVVRCKDCRHRDPEDHKCDCGQLERAGCPFAVSDDYFCAYGERMADND